MTTKSSLYSVPRPSKPKDTAPPPSSVAFTNTLSSILAQQTTQPPSKSVSSTGRTRPSKSTKDDIFTSHTRNTKKRAAADISTVDPTSYSKQRHQTSGTDVEGVDAASFARSRRKMEEKAALYASMKRGEYIPPKGKEHLEESQLVDFDRKWAEVEDANANGENTGLHHSDDEEALDSDTAQSDISASESLVDYTDEMGRTRQLPRSTALRLQQRTAAQSHAAAELSSFAARPSRPSNIIHGDAIQSQAFNPDAHIAASMAVLASKRDKSLTPPPDVHYDASKEVRSKGVGFYQFSQDEEGRKREFEALERERKETEEVKARDEERKVKRRREEEERRRVVQKRREERLAERFLKGLDE